METDLDTSSVGCTRVLGSDLKTVNADEGAESSENSSSIGNASPESLNGATNAGVSGTKSSPISKTEG